MKLTTEKERIEIQVLRKFGASIKYCTIEPTNNGYTIQLFNDDKKMEAILTVDKYMKESSYIQQINQMYNDFKQVC
jgi:DTW domain-containing protein YfiP